jgi:hypothetical protein
MKKLYTVHYQTNNYNQNTTYFRCANRYSHTKTFANDLDKAVEFAKCVNGKVYYLGIRIF